MTDRIDVQVELGCLFGTVHASLVGDGFVGAHVEIDGNVITDTGLLRLPTGADAEIELFRIAKRAYERACTEIAVSPAGRDIHALAVAALGEVA